MSSRIVFVDERVMDYQRLLAGMRESTECVLLDSQGDGLQQMFHVLQSKSGLRGIDVVSLGATGKLFWGGSVLNADSLASYTHELAELGHILTAQSHTLYADHIPPKGGRSEYLGHLPFSTSMEIAVSELLWKNNDWQLEANIARIESSALAAENYVKTLEWMKDLDVNSHDNSIVIADYTSPCPRPYQVVAMQLESKILVITRKVFYKTTLTRLTVVSPH